MPDRLIKNRQDSVIYALLLSLCFWVFALFIHRGFPVKWIALSLLIISIFLIVLKIDSLRSFSVQFRLYRGINPVKFISIGLLVGLLLAILNRISIPMSPIPSDLTWFALVAAAIGMTEELVFRGFIQSNAGKNNIIFGVFFASFSHSLYKCFLFLFPDPSYDYPLIFLFLLTFAVGLLAGWITVKSKSIYPALFGHAIFDIIVYGELTSAPWWVF